MVEVCDTLRGIDLLLRWWMGFKPFEVYLHTCKGLDIISPTFSTYRGAKLIDKDDIEAREIFPN